VQARTNPKPLAGRGGALSETPAVWTETRREMDTRAELDEPAIVKLAGEVFRKGGRDLAARITGEEHFRIFRHSQRRMRLSIVSVKRREFHHATRRRGARAGGSDSQD
jgi:hypothetical protein